MVVSSEEHTELFEAFKQYQVQGVIAVDEDEGIKSHATLYELKR